MAVRPICRKPSRTAPRAWLPGPTTKVGPEQRALEEVLRPGYFGGTLLRPGELIYVSARRRKRAGDGAPGEIHMALLMVAKTAERGGARSAPAVRLVQDFGCPDGPAALASATVTPLAPPAQAAPVKRGRRRPPGSRNKKNGALPKLLVN